MAFGGKVSGRSLVVSAAIGAALALVFGLFVRRGSTSAKPAVSASPSAARVAMRARALTLGRWLGKKPAPAQPAFPGLVLGKTQERQGIAWAKARKLDCMRKHKGLHYLICSGVPPVVLGEANASPDVKDLTLTFAPGGALVGVEALRLGVSEPQAEKLFTHAVGGLTRALGRPTAQKGKPGTGELGHSMHSVSARWAFSNYLATVRATHLPGGISFREEYQAAVGTPSAPAR